MKTYLRGTIALFWVFSLLTGCAATGGAKYPIDTLSSSPGTTVALKGETRRLTGTPLQIGSPLPSTVLIDAFSMQKADLSQMKGKVLLLSLVPSLDTKVCESQTHYLGEQGSQLSPGISRITISRDTPFAQKRFAEEAKLTGIMSLSDYRDSSFGRSTGPECVNDFETLTMRI